MEGTNNNEYDAFVANLTPITARQKSVSEMVYQIGNFCFNKLNLWTLAEKNEDIPSDKMKEFSQCFAYMSMARKLAPQVSVQNFNEEEAELIAQEFLSPEELKALANNDEK